MLKKKKKCGGARYWWRSDSKILGPETSEKIINTLILVKSTFLSNVANLPKISINFIQNLTKICQKMFLILPLRFIKFPENLCKAKVP